jgi:GNAT superfamily N-acetyltransferase
MRLRPMTKLDIPAGMRLKEVAGWNQTAGDWERFLEASPEGCFVAEIEGKVCGTATTISYEDRFAWVGMVLVDPEYRGRGMGTSLLERAIEYLDDLKIDTIKLDATPQGKPIYEKLGFVSEYEIERWVLRRAPMDVAKKTSSAGSSNKASTALLEGVLESDRVIFGADRSFLLNSLHREAPEFTFSTGETRDLDGYMFGRRGAFADHLGPWVAKDELTASKLLEVFLSQSDREVVLVDALKSNVIIGDLLRSQRFTFSRPLTRMYRGRNAFPGKTDKLCAILGPEFG